MSGYRSLHRQQIVVPEQQKQEEPPQNEPIAIWDIETTCLLLNPSAQRQRNSNRNCWRIWIATSDGSIRTYKVHEKTINDTASSSSLDASALSLQCTHILKSRTHPNSDSGLFGCTRITTIRNYIGTDNNDGVGNLIMASIDLIGTIRIWNFDENWDDTTGNNDKNPMEEPKTIQAMHEFKTVPNATGTMAQLVILASSPNNIIGDVVMIAVGCLDGTIVFVSTGISVYKGAASEPENETNTAPGTIMDTIGRPGSSVPLSMTISKSATSSATNVAVGRQDGTIDIFTIMNDKQHQQHRLLQLVGYPTRGISFMEDGCLFIAGNDNGTICLWDVSRNRSDPNGAATNHNSYNTSSQHHQQPPVLVHHVLNSNSSNESSWIVDIQPLEDNRRFVTLHMDKTIQIWKLGQSLNQQHPVHTFQLDNVCWTIQRHGNEAKQRLISGSENGWIQIFSLE